MGDRPRVFVARRIPDDGLQPVSQACEAEIWPVFKAGMRARTSRTERSW